ncbi:Signal peptide peptidase-like 2B, partial [Clonorchis sinensis]
ALTLLPHPFYLQVTGFFPPLYPMESTHLITLIILVTFTSSVQSKLSDKDGLVVSIVKGNLTLRQFCASGIPNSESHVEFAPTERMHLISWIHTENNGGSLPDDSRVPLAILLRSKQIQSFQLNFQPRLFLLSEDDPSSVEQLDVSHVVLRPGDFAELVELSSSPNGSETMLTIFRDPPISRQLEIFNPAVLLIYTIALLSIVLGCAMIFLSYEELLREMQARNAAFKQSKWAMYVALGLLLVLASGFILIYYYLYDTAVYFAISLFFCCGILAVTNVLAFWVTYFFPAAKKRFPVNFRLCRFHVGFNVSVTKLAVSPVGIALMVVWLIFRKEEFIGWHLQTAVGVFMVAWLLSSGIPLPSLKLITICFAMFLAYDVFFVFITPYFQQAIEPPPPTETHVIRSRRSASNELSYMEAIATGSAGKSGETIPASFRIHLVLTTGQYGCRQSAYSILLGFGDAIFPGLLCAFLAFYDSLWKIRLRMNFLASLFGYMLGMLTTQFVMTLTDRGQPALLYLCPFTLGTTVLFAAIFLGKEELQKMWKGAFPLVTSEDPGDLRPSGDQLKDDEYPVECTGKSTDSLVAPNDLVNFDHDDDPLRLSTSRAV